MDSKGYAAVFGRVVQAVVLLVLAGFCAFGFLASFEYPGVTWWHIGYASLTATFVTLEFLVLRKLLQRPQPAS